MDKDNPTKSFFKILSEDGNDYPYECHNDEPIYEDEEIYFMGSDWCGIDDDDVLECTLLDTHDVYYVLSIEDD